MALPHRPDAAFDFGLFDIEQSLTIDHQYDRTPSIPRPGQPMTLRVTTGTPMATVSVWATVGPAAPQPAQIVSTGREYPARLVGRHWEAVIPGMRDGEIVHYVVGTTDARGRRRFADGWAPERAATVFAHRVTSRRPPPWTRDAVIYQIFVDRFRHGRDPVVVDRPDAFAGGNLDGVTANLDYIADLGVNVVWLTPIFECHSYHGYDTTDYFRIDPRFGDEAALRRLVTAAHERNLRILLDYVPNHCSDRHPWFVEAAAGGERRDWFFFDGHGDYATFLGVRSLPKLNLDHPDARAEMIRVARYWLDEFGVDGFRVDHGLGPSPSFFASLAADLNAAHPEAFVFGENTATAALLRRYGGLLDGATDFLLAYGLRDWFAGELSAAGLVEVEQEAAAILPHEDFAWVRFADNHDMDRARHRWADDSSTVVAALQALLGLPGVPTIFYGTEQGLTHDAPSSEHGLEVGRVPMTLDGDPQLHAAIRSLVRARAGQSPDPGTPVYWDFVGERATWSWGDCSGAL